MSEIKDMKHIELINLYLNNFDECRPEYIANIKRKIEYVFSCYGDRGSIDMIDWDHKYKHIIIYEFKTTIWDIGELIRQIEKYTLICGNEHPGYTIFRKLIISKTNENLKTFYDNIEIFTLGLPSTLVLFVDTTTKLEMMLDSTNIYWNRSKIEDCMGLCTHQFTVPFILNRILEAGYQIHPDAVDILMECKHKIEVESKINNMIEILPSELLVIMDTCVDGCVSPHDCAHFPCSAYYGGNV